MENAFTILLLTSRAVTSRAKASMENLFRSEKVDSKFLDIANGLTLLQNLQVFFIIQVNIY